MTKLDKTSLSSLNENTEHQAFPIDKNFAFLSAKVDQFCYDQAKLREWLAGVGSGDVGQPLLDAPKPLSVPPSHP
jgi:hypothetical protein